MEKNYEQYAFAQNMMGVIYVSLGNESAAMDCYLEVLECSKRHGITSVLALAYNNIGSRYQELRQHQKAIGYFERSADELEKVGEEIGVTVKIQREEIFTKMHRI